MTVLYTNLGAAKAVCSSPDADDALVDQCIVVASRSIAHWCGRTFEKAGTATARYFTSASRSLTFTDDIWDLDGLIVATDDADDGTYSTEWTAADYALELVNNLYPDGPWNRIVAVGREFPVTRRPRNVKGTAKWGWPRLPEEIELACQLLTQQLYRVKGAPFGFASVGDIGIVKIRQSAVIQELLNPYRGAGAAVVA